MALTPEGSQPIGLPVSYGTPVVSAQPVEHPPGTANIAGSWGNTGATAKPKPPAPPQGITASLAGQNEGGHARASRSSTNSSSSMSASSSSATGAVLPRGSGDARGIAQQPLSGPMSPELANVRESNNATDPKKSENGTDCIPDGFGKPSERLGKATAMYCRHQGAHHGNQPPGYRMILVMRWPREPR